MYTLKKGSKTLLESPNLKPCAEMLNKLAGFRVVDKHRDYISGIEYYLNNVCFICYEDYIFTGSYGGLYDNQNH